MEKDIDRIAKNAETDIVIRIDEYGGKRGVTIREFVKSERYTGFTKSGTRIPADKFKIFKAAINAIDEKELESEMVEESSEVKKGVVKKEKSKGASHSMRDAHLDEEVNVVAGSSQDTTEEEI